METKYAKFWKCALQVNPWSYSKEFQGIDHGLSEDSYNTAMVQSCLANNIAVVGLADHGNVESSDSLRRALSSAGVVVLPGFEITSTEKVHMVCLFPDSTALADLQRHLGSIMSPGGKGTSPSTHSCLQIARKIQERNGFWYAAHVTGANGLLRLNQDGGGLPHIWRECGLVLAAQIPADITSLEPGVRAILSNKDPNYRRSRPVALLNAKDVRLPDDLTEPSSFCWAKMTTPSIDALKLACQDAESRIRLSRDMGTSYYSRIDRIEIARGYLGGLQINLSPNLNAIVGGRGTGKTTLIEGLRHALELEPVGADCTKIHKSIVGENFDREQAVVEIVVTSFAQNSETYVVRKETNEPARVFDVNNDELDLSPRDLLPKIEIYGQNELLDILQDEEAKSTLIGRFLEKDERTEEAIRSEEEHLRENRETIDESEVKYQDLTTRLERLPLLTAQEKSFKRLGLEKLLEQVKARESERAFCNELEQSMKQMLGVAEVCVKSLSDLEPADTPGDLSKRHSARIRKLEAALRKGQREASKAARTALSAVQAAQQTFIVASRQLEKSWSHEESSFNSRIGRLPVTQGKTPNQLATDYKRVSKLIAELKPLRARRNQLETKIAALVTERQAIQSSLDSLRHKRLSSLKTSIRDLNRRLDGLLKVECNEDGHRQPLKDFLLKCRLDGVGEKRLSWIDECDTMSISDLVSAAKEGAECIAQAYKGAGISRPAAEAIAGLAPRRLRELEEVVLPEALRLYLNIDPDRKIYREVSTLSTGQRCTAILHLLLLDNPDPLVIDQPEDNLDNAFIADHVVDVLRKNKTKRQFLFATHNANIPVFGDAEWIGIFEEENRTAKLRASGSIDAHDVKELAANILEGGKEAFNRRREKYGL